MRSGRHSGRALNEPQACAALPARASSGQTGGLAPPETQGAQTPREGAGGDPGKPSPPACRC
eukprot:4226213-Lingulodinium_polyedra.AAC.1